ncbi:MAG: DUF993 family protein [Planctomycetota bacterium]|nr:DUF993 family protein [Planctomycetota bacterium]
MRCEVQVPKVLGGGELVLDDGRLERARAELAVLGAERGPAAPARLVFAATHIVMQDDYAEVPHDLATPVPAAALGRHIDWDATAALRVRLDRLGFGIAEAMDTAQRFHIGWENALGLVEATGAAGLTHGFLAGAGVDHLAHVPDEDALVEGVVFQARAIQAAGGMVILLPLVWLCQQAYDEDGYVRVYRRVIDALDGPLFVHWLGAMFLPALAGYFPGDAFRRILALDPAKVRGAKLSLLDDALERELRAELGARDQLMLTGDDFHFGELMASDGHLAGGQPAPVRTTSLAGSTVGLGDFSHGLLGIFDGIAEPASLALGFLAQGDPARYLELMGPCEELGRHLFGAPTQHYKAGLAFLSWLDGHQPNPMLALHEERARDHAHYLEAARLASLAGVFTNAELAAERLAQLLGT